MQANTLGEVGNLGTVLLRVYSGTVLPIFIEIGLYLTDKEQNIRRHSFLSHGVHPRFLSHAARSIQLCIHNYIHSYGRRTMRKHFWHYRQTSCSYIERSMDC